MNRLERDAQEFSAHLKSGGWRLGLLVARNVERGRGGSGRKGVSQPRNPQKVTAAQFAKMGAKATTADRVLRHLEAWEKAAAAGLVPLAADLGPNSEPELDMEKLPPWTDYYSTQSARPSDPWRSPKTRRAAIDTLSHQEKADLVGQTVDSDPTVLHTVARQSPTARQQMRHSVVPPAGLGGAPPEFPKPVEGVRLRFVRDVRDYAASLRFMADEFGDLTDQQVSQLLDAHEALETRIKANIIRLRQRLGLATEDDVIEGHEATPVSELEWQQD